MGEEQNRSNTANNIEDKDNRCFVIMPISDQGDYPKGHFQKVYEQIFKPAIEKAGYQPYRVDENTISDRIIDKIFAAIQECPMALCDLSNRNPNVLYELGLRQAYDKPVVLVQDEKTDKIFDVSGISTVFYKSDRVFENVIAAREKIEKALNDTREGKRNSIVTIVNAQTAKISSGNVTAEEKIEIMLSSIVGDLKELKEDGARKENVYIDCLDMTHNRDDNYGEYLFPVHRIRLKQGITNSRIAGVINDLMFRFCVDIIYTRRRNKLKVVCCSKNATIVNNIITILHEKIGDDNQYF